jgi:hypothetical protein
VDLVPGNRGKYGQREHAGAQSADGFAIVSVTYDEQNNAQNKTAAQRYFDRRDTAAAKHATDHAV